MAVFPVYRRWIEVLIVDVRGRLENPLAMLSLFIMTLTMGKISLLAASMVVLRSRMNNP